MTVLGGRGAYGAVVPVGPGDGFAAIEAAEAGDIVELAPGTYQFRLHLTAEGTADNPIVIRAADPADPPVWDLGGTNVNDWPGSYGGGDNDRGCWQVRGSGYEISGIVMRDCGNAGGNAAGIRVIGGQDVTIRDVLFEGNDVGFSGDGENIVVEYCEFVDNGQQSNPPQHSIYIYGGSFYLRYSYLHDSAGGQNLHIRARESVIEYNWIARAQNYEADMMTGDDPDHSMLFRGNVVVGHANPENGGRIFVLHNDAGDPGVTMNLRLLWNTFYIQADSNPALVRISDDTLESATVEISNNIVLGTNLAVRLVDGGLGNTTISGTNNWFQTGADVGPLAGTIFGDDPGFGNAGALDFGLIDGSPALGSADVTVADAPGREFFENESNPRMFRWRPSVGDLGAFEQNTQGPGFGAYDDPTEPPTGGSSGGDGGADGGTNTGAGGDDAGDGGDAGADGGDAGTDGGGGPGPAGTAAGTQGGGSAGAASDSEDGGCGCHSGRSGGGAGLLLWLPVLALRRRRRGAA